MATAFGLLLAAIFACTTNAAIASVVHRECCSGNGDLRIQRPTPGGYGETWVAERLGNSSLLDENPEDVMGCGYPGIDMTCSKAANSFSVKCDA